MGPDTSRPGRTPRRRDTLSLLRWRRTWRKTDLNRRIGAERDVASLADDALVDRPRRADDGQSDRHGPRQLRSHRADTAEAEESSNRSGAGTAVRRDRVYRLSGIVVKLVLLMSRTPEPARPARPQRIASSKSRSLF